MTSGTADGSSGGRSQSWGGCGYARRRRRRRQRADDLLSQLGLAGSLYWDSGDEMGDGAASGEERSKAAARIQELEKTVETMGATITALAERVKVLERIVVDDEANIAREIDKLKGEDR